MGATLRLARPPDVWLTAGARSSHMAHEEQSVVPAEAEPRAGLAERPGRDIRRSWLSPFVSGLSFGWLLGFSAGVWAGVGLGLFFFLSEAALVASRRGHLENPVRVER